MTISIRTKLVASRYAYIIWKNGRHYKTSANDHHTEHDAIIAATEYIAKATRDHKEFAHS